MSFLLQSFHNKIQMFKAAYAQTHTHTSSTRCIYHMEQYSVFFLYGREQLVISDVGFAV